MEEKRSVYIIADFALHQNKIIRKRAAGHIRLHGLHECQRTFWTLPDWSLRRMERENREGFSFFAKMLYLKALTML